MNYNLHLYSEENNEVKGGNDIDRMYKITDKIKYMHIDTNYKDEMSRRLLDCEYVNQNIGIKKLLDYDKINQNKHLKQRQMYVKINKNIIT